MTQRPCCFRYVGQVVVAEQPPVALAPMIGHMKARMAQLKDWLDDDDLVVR